CVAMGIAQLLLWTGITRHPSRWKMCGFKDSHAMAEEFSVSTGFCLGRDEMRWVN
ncbi:unnamed protein product, partial [Ilex paraguariensis]